MFHQQRNEPHESVQCVEALGAHDHWRGVVLFGERPVAQIDAHLGAQTEEAGDEVVSFQDSVHVHLKIED